MFRKKRVIFALVVIFICGIATGLAIAPTMRYYTMTRHHSVGNPYSKASLAQHIFFTNHMDWSKFDADKKTALESLVNKNVKKYEGALEIFRIESSDIFIDYLVQIKPILTEDEYNDYVDSVKEEQDKRDSRYKTLTKEAKKEK